MEKTRRIEDGESPLSFDLSEQIQTFDWEDLERRFGEQMAQCNKKEQKLLDEFQSLMTVLYSVFSVDRL